MTSFLAGSRGLLPDGMVVLERGWLSSNNVVFRGAESAAIVDTGYWTHSDQTVALVTGSIGNLPLATIASTHLHSDHCGGNAALQSRFTGVRTLIPPGQAGAVRAWDPVALTYEPTGQYCPRFSVDGLLVPGELVRLGDLEWEVHGAPGHDPHSVILFHPDSGTLISADALWENGFGVVFQELEGIHAFDEVAATLDVIEKLGARVVVPGHGAVFSDVAGAITRARSRLAAYQANPSRHAAHAAKVLLKFKLLELQGARLDAFVAWAESTHYFGLVHRRWFAQIGRREWIGQLIGDLIAAGAVARQDDMLFNT